MAAGLIVLTAFLVFAGHEHTHASDGKAITSKEQLNHENIRIGVGQGGYAEQVVGKELPKARRVFLVHTDGYQAVAEGKVDAFIFERYALELAIKSGLEGVRLLDENMDETIPVAVGISPVSHIDDLKGKIDSFIDEMKENGTLDDMYDRWVIKNEDEMPEIKPADDPKIHLKIGTTGIVPPFSYYKDQDLCGYDIELAYRFASWLGADLEFRTYDFNGLITAAATGDADLLMSELNVTPEREAALPFSEPLFEIPIGIMVHDSSGTASGSGASFLWKVKTSFEKNFIREGRWKLFLKGVLVTFLITALSMIFGTILGFVLFLWCRNGNRTANAVTGVFGRLIQGMPMVVLLMILYYIVFKEIDIGGVMVSVIAFSMTFGLSVYGLLKVGVGAVDRGQYEAAYALGYSVNRTFFRIILPQALPHVMDSYRSETVTLIKATAIVGYIAVQDLTKVGDIVRARTYEAFFPLIAIAVIYFGLEALFGFAVSRICILFDRKKKMRTGILKGVKLK